MNCNPPTSNLWKEQVQAINQYLDSHLHTNNSPTLEEAMRYSTLSGGKRLRGILCISAYGSISTQTDISPIVPIAAGIECIHTMSLIHDDMPCMDDDDLRRGNLSCHKQYPEYVALLAGDNLLSKGISFCLQSNIPAPNKLKIIDIITQAFENLCEGQILDMQQATQTSQNLDTLLQIHKNKTGKLIEASILSGAIAAQASPSQITTLTTYAEKIGLAFQVVDDCLDLESTPDTLGKNTQKDQQLNKLTFPGIIGLKESKNYANQLIKEAINSISQDNIPNTATMIDIAKYMASRNH